MNSLAQRWQRFLDEDAVTLVGSTTVMLGAMTVAEFRKAAAPRRLQQALTKTLPMLPLGLISSTIGIVGMKWLIAGVSTVRQDYSRSSTLVALPLMGALVQAPRGPRAMLRGGLTLGAMGFAADYAFSAYHQRQRLLLEATYDTEEYPLEHHAMGSFSSQSAYCARVCGCGLAPCRAVV